MFRDVDRKPSKNVEDKRTGPVSYPAELFGLLDNAQKRQRNTRRGLAAGTNLRGKPTPFGKLVDSAYRYADVQRYAAKRGAEVEAQRTMDALRKPLKKPGRRRMGHESSPMPR